MPDDISLDTIQDGLIRVERDGELVSEHQREDKAIFSGYRAKGLAPASEVRIVRPDLRVEGDVTCPEVATEEPVDEEPTPDPDPETTPTDSAFFSDSFESGDLSHTEGGTSWTSGGSTVLRVSTEQANTGEHSCLFHYTGGSSPELRYNLGAQYTELWIEWYFWFPSDFQKEPGNDKLWLLWGGDYDDAGAPKVGMEYLADAGSGPEANLRIMYDPAGNAATRTCPDGDIVNWILGDGVVNRGAWNQMRVHVNIGTTATTDGGHETGDGVYEVWTNGVLLMSDTNLGLYPAVGGGTFPYWNTGYFFGSSNSDPSDLSVYIDDVKFYDSDPGW